MRKLKVDEIWEVLAIMHFWILYVPFSYMKTRIKIYNTETLPVILYGHETWYCMLRYEYKLSVENRMHRRLAGPKKDQEMGG
jgi:hypothetical protein